MNNVIEFKPWEVWEFPWGTAIKKRNNEWSNIYLSPNGYEIDLEAAGVKVILHDNGIEFTN